MKQFIKREAGYTLLEVLTAMALFLILIIPFYQFILFFVSNSRTIDTLNAINLAETEIEKAIIRKASNNRDYLIENNGKIYRICMDSIYEQNLVFLKVSVYSLPEKRELVSFMTYYLKRANSP